MSNAPGVGPRPIQRGTDFPFFIGVVGTTRIDPAELADLRLRVRAALEWVRAEHTIASATATHSPDERAPSGLNHGGTREASFLTEYGRILEDLSRAGGGSPDPAATSAWRGLGLKRTPLVVLSGMAPGAEQLVAEIADQLHLQVEVPLPLPREQMDHPDIYQDAVEPWEGASCIDRHPHYRVHLVADANLRQTKDDFQAIAGAGSAELRRQRAERLRAVGEFVAIHSDLLIVIDRADSRPDPNWENDLSIGGSAVAIEARRSGPTPNLLPGPSGFDWADNGPTFLLPVERPVGDNDRPAPPLLVLHPYDCAVECAELEEEGHGVSSNSPAPNGAPLTAGVGDPGSPTGWRRFEQLAASLERLNQDLPPPPTQDPLPRLLPPQAKPPYCPPTRVPHSVVNAGSPASVPPLKLHEAHGLHLRHLALARRRVADNNRALDRQVTELKRDLLIAGFLMVALLQIAELWVPPDEHPQLADHYHALRSLAAVGAVAIFLGALYQLRLNQDRLWRWIRRWTAVSEPAMARGSLFHRLENSRALAEGLRVQFYWSAAGVGLSVAANYLLRARGELQWIRAAIAAHGVPYEVDRDAFLDLGKAEQVGLLERVRWGWLQEQAHYFSTKVDELSRELVRVEFQTICLISAGFVGLLLPLAYHLSHLSALVHFLPSPAALLLGLGCAGAALYLLESPREWLTEWQRRTSQGGTLDDDQRERLTSALHRLHGVAWPTCLGLGVGIGAVLVAHDLPPNPYLPNAQRLSVIFSSLCFGGATFLHLASQWRFTSEHLHRYQAMRGVFASADRRLGEVIERMRNADDPTHSRLINDAHGILAAIGRDALDENSEWYVLHRTHPLKPVNPHG